MERYRTFNGPAGPLEGALFVPDTPGPYPAVVVCHPHPLYGGSMDNNVVMAVCLGNYRQGIATLRFNFRGVGNSGGTHDKGVGEQDDVRAALEFLAQQEDIDPERIGLAGYSFGARTVLNMAESAPQVKALALVSPPMRDIGIQLATFIRPKFLVVGDRDNGIPAEAVQKFAEGLPAPTEVQIVRGADHFWGGFEASLTQMVGQFFAATLRGQPE